MLPYTASTLRHARMARNKAFARLDTELDDQMFAVRDGKQEYMDYDWLAELMEAALFCDHLAKRIYFIHNHKPEQKEGLND